MIVPLPDLRNFAAHGAHIVVHEVVAIAAPEFVQGLGHFGDFFGGQIFPQRAIAQLDFGGDGAVGINRVAAVQEHIRIGFAHGFINAHAAKGFVDAKALACGIAAPDHAKRTSRLCVAGQRRAKVALHGRRAHIGAGKIFQHHAIKNVLPGGQALQINAARAVAAGQ